jgi:hypothetical protein
MTMPTLVTPRAHDDGGVDDNPAARPRRRQFSAEYKVGIARPPRGERRSSLPPAIPTAFSTGSSSTGSPTGPRESLLRQDLGRRQGLGKPGGGLFGEGGGQ